MKNLNFIQNVLIQDGLFVLMFIPFLSLFMDMGMPSRSLLFIVSFFTAFLVMAIRPLADIFPEFPILRKLVLFRKGVGILSASIIVGFMFEKIIAPGSTYLASIFSADYYSFNNYAIFAHLGDLSGFILLITSNKLSQKILKNNWKRIQRLSYVYFYAGGIYEAFFLHNTFALYALFIITDLTILAWAWKIVRKRNKLNAQYVLAN
jgi:DMSO/TMAO reductase YedYZ heme-binding membrane subunit